MSCDSDDCAAVATERRGRALFCTRHAREHDEAVLLCDFDECPHHATVRRGPMQFCAQHAAEHDDHIADYEAGQ